MMHGRLLHLTICIMANGVLMLTKLSPGEPNTLLKLSMLHSEENSKM